MAKIVAVSEKVQSAGRLFMWTLRGSTPVRDLKRAWVMAGLDESELPEAPSPETALRRAVAELREQHRLVRSLGRGNGFVVKNERKVAGDLEYSTEMKAHVDKVGRLVLDGGSMKARDTVREMFEVHGENLSREDISTWLVGLIPTLDGVAMRDNGGVYFIPKRSLPRLKKIIEAIRHATNHSLYAIPAAHEDDEDVQNDLVMAVLDSVEAEAAAEAGRMEAELEAEQYGSKAYQNRIEFSDAVEQKVGRYEELVGGKLDSIRDRLQKLRANLTVAMVKAQAEEDRKAGHASLADI